MRARPCLLKDMGSWTVHSRHRTCYRSCNYSPFEVTFAVLALRLSCMSVKVHGWHAFYEAHHNTSRDTGRNIAKRGLRCLAQVNDPS